MAEEFGLQGKSSTPLKHVDVIAANFRKHVSVKSTSVSESVTNFFRKPAFRKVACWKAGVCWNVAEATSFLVRLFPENSSYDRFV